MLGPGFGNHERSGAMGGRAAQYVEAHPAAKSVVSRWQPAPVAALLTISGLAVESASSGFAGAGLWAAASTSFTVIDRLTVSRLLVALLNFLPYVSALSCLSMGRTGSVVVPALG